MALVAVVWVMFLCSTVSTIAPEPIVDDQLFGKKITEIVCHGNKQFPCGDVRVVLNCTKGRILIDSIDGPVKRSQMEQHTSGNNDYQKMKLLFYEECSGRNLCMLHAPPSPPGNIPLNTKLFHLTYRCIADNKTEMICQDESNTMDNDDGTQTRDIVFLMYKQENETTHGECKCSVEADMDGSTIDVYSLDIRFQNQQMGHCSGATLAWGDDHNQHEETCLAPTDYPNITTLATWETRSMWIKLNFTQGTPRMVWIVAKASEGGLSVACEEEAVDVIASGSRGETTIRSSTFRNEGSETAKHGTDSSPDDETNSGSIVAAAIGSIVFVASVITGIVFWRRCEAKLTAGNQTHKFIESVGKRNADYDLAEPVAMPSTTGRGNERQSRDTISEENDTTYCYINPDNMAAQTTADLTESQYIPNDSNYNYIDPRKMAHQAKHDSKEDYNHLYEVPSSVGVHSTNVYSHLTVDQGSHIAGYIDYDHIVHKTLNSPRNVTNVHDDYDHIKQNERSGTNKETREIHPPDTTVTAASYNHHGLLEENVRNAIPSNYYDHLSSAEEQEQHKDQVQCNDYVTPEQNQEKGEDHVKIPKRTKQVENDYEEATIHL
ncbi:hypothetical protein ScPMuIL_012277 [Solemya velum]